MTAKPHWIMDELMAKIAAPDAFRLQHLRKLLTERAGT